MGLFSKKKKEDKGASAAPSTGEPPVPPTLSDVGHNVGSAPNVPDLSAPPMPDTTAPPAPEIPSPQTGLPAQDAGLPSLDSKLSAPPVPGGSPMDDIKSEVSAPGVPQAPAEEPSTELKVPDMGDDGKDLFDMFGVGSDESPSADEALPPQQTPEEENDAFNLEDLTPVDEKVQRSDSFNFDSGSVKSDSKFLTTSQFKSMLELIEQVKNKVKETNEVHLRMLDMKSEEDIEYENLRKSFQFLEDKLYELDGIVFEK